MYVADINDYLTPSSLATTEKTFSADVQFSSADVNESYLPDPNLMSICFFIAVLVFFFLVSAGYALYYRLQEPSDRLFASETDTTFSRGRTPPPNPKEIRDEPVPPIDQSNEPPADEDDFKNVVTGVESVLRSILSRFFKKKAPEYGDVWHTGVDQDVRQTPFISIDLDALQNAVPLRSLDDADF